MDKREQWERIKKDWPDLAEFLIEINKEGMKAERVDVKQWPSNLTGKRKGY